MNATKKVIVLLSVYKNDKPDWISECLESMVNQTYKNIHILLTIDGGVSKELNASIQSFQNENITIFSHESCKGLAFRLNQLIDYSLENIKHFDYFARMDADDIASLDRFEIQVDYLNNNSNVDIVGSDIFELETASNSKKLKKMPQTHEDIIKKIIQRCPLNHPTVMLRKEIFFNPDNRYDPNLKNTQDYKLWVDLISKGFKIANINIPLLTFRISSDFYKKRGLSKLKNDINTRIYAIKKLKQHSIKNYFHLLLLLSLRVSPKFLVRLAYKLR